jgi:hypothetical protein
MANAVYSLPMTLKDLILKLIPTSLRAARRDRLQRKRWQSFEKLTPAEAFARTYATNLWGGSNGADDGFYSGSGSHTPEFVAAYVGAVGPFLESLGKPDVADLGCGDFAVGSQIVPFCGSYLACDVVAPLIERNRQKFASLPVVFQQLDMTSDPLPHAEVIFIRQVLQHLSNAQIAATVAKIPAACRYLVLTEHLPHEASFTPNLDKPVGPHTRLEVVGVEKSGVVLTEAPFNLKPLRSSTLCEVSDMRGIIRTTLYEFKR